MSSHYVRSNSVWSHDRIAKNIARSRLNKKRVDDLFEKLRKTQEILDKRYRANEASYDRYIYLTEKVPLFTRILRPYLASIKEERKMLDDKQAMVDSFLIELNTEKDFLNRYEDSILKVTSSYIDKVSIVNGVPILQGVQPSVQRESREPRFRKPKVYSK